MIHHLILAGEDGGEIRLKEGMLCCGQRSIALQVLGSLQCFASRMSWSQSALCALARQCPAVMARWNTHTGKWETSAIQPRCRYVNPDVTSKVCRLNERQATPYASALLFTKVQNQHALIRSLEPDLGPLPRLASNSYSRILMLEAKWARFFWARYFHAASQDLFTREKRQAKAPLNVALNYGYAFLYHALEWQCIASGIEPGVGIVHRLRRSRPSLVCDLIEPMRCCVELTVMRHLDEMHDKKLMAGRFAEMMESSWNYADRRFRLRSIIRLHVESFARAVLAERPSIFHPFSLHARDACL
ncbi:MAG: CRISPR-associated endonuclease Cas1 [Akkermansia sp.]|nr:CRISPR-associated endonuclease Cas1 [Akkermansia sp.]